MYMIGRILLNPGRWVLIHLWIARYCASSLFVTKTRSGPNPVYSACGMMGTHPYSLNTGRLLALQLKIYVASQLDYSGNDISQMTELRPNLFCLFVGKLSTIAFNGYVKTWLLELCANKQQGMNSNSLMPEYHAEIKTYNKDQRLHRSFYQDYYYNST